MIDVPADADAIETSLRRALEPGFRASLGDVVNPYGDGRAAARIARILAEVPLGPELLLKEALRVD